MFTGTNHKIKAMTLHEMLVVLIISVIVIGIAFTVLTLVQKHIWSIQKHITANSTLVRLEQSLWIDFNRYNDISYDSKNFKIKFSNAIDSTSYILTENYLLKEKDTFNIKLISKKVFFDGKPITNGTVDALKLNIGNKKLQKTLFVFKRKDAKQFIN